MEAEIIGLIIGIAALTFFTRFAFTMLFRRFKISERWNMFMVYVPIAVFTTIIVPALLVPNGELDISFQNEYLIAGIIALLVAYKTKNVVGTVIIGISLILFLRLVLGL